MKRPWRLEIQHHWYQKDEWVCISTYQTKKAALLAKKEYSSRTNRLRIVERGEPAKPTQKPWRVYCTYTPPYGGEQKRVYLGSYESPAKAEQSENVLDYYRADNYDRFFISHAWLDIVYLYEPLTSTEPCEIPL